MLLFSFMLKVTDCGKRLHNTVRYIDPGLVNHIVWAELVWKLYRGRLCDISWLFFILYRDETGDLHPLCPTLAFLLVFLFSVYVQSFEKITSSTFFEKFLSNNILLSQMEIFFVGVACYR